jgi:hypothetical protein
VVIQQEPATTSPNLAALPSLNLIAHGALALTRA